ncbi:MAG: VTT domain-containing protein [Pseudorhodoplanes sp.]
MADYLILFAVVLGVNLMPAFGPPTWAVLVLFVLGRDLPPVPTIALAAAAAALGRLGLACTFRFLSGRLPRRMRRNLDGAREAVERNRRNGILALGLLALSPVPSAQLFEAAGLARVRLVPFTLAFFAGRVVSYSIYVFSAAGLRATTLGDTFRDALTSPAGIALQFAMIAALVAFTLIDWPKWLGRKNES